MLLHTHILFVTDCQLGLFEALENCKLVVMVETNGPNLGHAICIQVQNIAVGNSGKPSMCDARCLCLGR